MRTLAAVLLGKFIGLVSRKLKIGGGSAAPGFYALEIDPNLVENLSKKIARNVVITGTNGKTTTARLVAHFATQAGLKVIRNHTGSNLERGIASALIDGVRLTYPRHGLNRHTGIWELDEAAFNLVAPKIKPDVVVFLNVFRDQLDRYGEVDSVVNRWCETLKALKSQTVILVNGDDVNTNKLANCFEGKIQKFGLENYKLTGESLEKINRQHKLDFEAKNIKLNGLRGSSFELKINNLKFKINLPLPGVYHIYDALAAIACVTYLFPAKLTHQLSEMLKTFSPAFGRVEKFSLQPPRLYRKVDGYIFLIKNPAGATQVFETIAPQIEKDDRLLLALNDNLADGTDVSWIWDGKFERLQVTDYRLQVVCSGTRAYDLANRLKYAGFKPDNLIIQPDLKKALQQARLGLKGRLFVLPTYTAMLELQKNLTKEGIKGHYWEE